MYIRYIFIFFKIPQKGKYFLQIFFFLHQMDPIHGPTIFPQHKIIPAILQFTLLEKSD